MRNVTNALMFVVALLIVMGMFVLRDQSFKGLERSLGAFRAKVQPVVAKRQIPFKNERSRPAARRRLEESRNDAGVDVTVTVIPVAPRSASETIQVGMVKERLWDDFGVPDAITSSRDGDRFLETFIYLLEPSKATIVRLVNGSVTSVKNTRTISPPLLVPQPSGAKTPITLASDKM